MASNDPTTVIILAEIIAVQTVILIGIGIFAFIQKKKKAKILEASTLAFKENSADRTQLLKTTFNGLAGENINTITEDIVAKEVEFHRHMSNIFYKNDLAGITALDQVITDMVAPYAQLASSTTTAGDNTPKQEPTAPAVDDAIDEFLSDDEEDTKDPALDLSDATSEEDNEPGIAEIPDELLNSDTIVEDDSSASEK
jgi:hypothetical protein